MNPRIVNTIGRRRLLGLALVAPVAIALAACGDDSTSSSDTGATTGSTLPPVDTTVDAPPTTAGPDSYAHPTGADDIVLEISYEGGFVPREVAFTNLPTLLVTGDGRVLSQGPQIAILPGPLLPNVVQRTITEDGIQELLALADEHGLFAEADYSGPEDVIADAPNTVVTISANGTTITHTAYALGIDTGTGESDARERLAAFVAAASDIQAAVADDQLGPEEPYVAESYRLNAYEAGDPSGYDVEPTIVEWPADASVSLADASECVLAPVAEFGELFATATQLTWFVEAGTTYAVAVAPFLPGDTC